MSFADGFVQSSIGALVVDIRGGGIYFATASPKHPIFCLPQAQ